MKLVFFFSFILAFQTIAQTDSLNIAPPTSIQNVEKHSIWATEYYVHITQSEGTIPYLSSTGDTLGYFSDTCDFCTACLEGTVFIESDSTKQQCLITLHAHKQQL